MEIDESDEICSNADHQDEFDPSAYIVYKKFTTVFPCLSFDVIRDQLGDDRSGLYPLTSYLACGTSESSSVHNSLLVLKLSNVFPLEDDEELEESDDEEDQSQEPVLSVSKIAHRGGINRIRATNLQGRHVAATWSEMGVVQVWDLQRHLAAVDGGSTAEQQAKPLFTFSGHSQEGYGLDWSPLVPGKLATGGNDAQIFIWDLTEDGWRIFPTPLSGHTTSIEDIQWSPNEQNVLATCSADHTVKVWDVRNCNKPPQMDLTAHDTDVNVISWNKKHTQYLLSGGDDGVVKLWDFRYVKNNGAAIQINYHKKPITTVQWHPTDETCFAVASEDNTATHWDLSLEPEEADEDEECPQFLLFEHGGQSEIKELHWHPQMPDVVITTAMDAFNIYRANNSPDINAKDDDEEEEEEE